MIMQKQLLINFIIFPHRRFQLYLTHGTRSTTELLLYDFTPMIRSLSDYRAFKLGSVETRGFIK
jgi:hypothetical protein